ncbi:HAD-like domain-containing protein [Lipomyces oligophaga]|uniref:HAD-like domain-containing protein n=1 Tax=Lipomyces oligophaga TaxID=45792 RepID=UPI0034CFD47A
MEAEIKYIIIDIEGTICSISFVKDILFPYFLDKIQGFINNYFSNSESSADLKPYIDSFPEEYRDSPTALLEHIRELTTTDQKVASLKSLQGYIWKTGYLSGELCAPLYDDAYAAIDRWSRSRHVYVYSSGSVPAQILLFKHTGRGDYTDKLEGYFDTVSAGLKTLSDSYSKIVEAITVGSTDISSQILFLSDNVNEIKAAINAGLHAYVVDRPGNAPLSEVDRQLYKVVTTFDGLL